MLEFPNNLNFQVTFEDTEYMADYMEGNLPEFRCMNEHYGMTFEKGEAGEDSAVGFLTSEKVRAVNCVLIAECC